MSGNHLPILRHVLPMTAVRRERRLPIPGNITVRVHEKVQAADVVAEAEEPPRHLFLDIARGLGISPADAARALRVELGSRVEAGQILAGPVGLARRTLRAPGDGRVLQVSRGRLLFEARPLAYAVHAGFPGEVVATDGSRVVTLETHGALLQGVWGNGRRGWGVMRMIGEGPDEHLLTDKLDIILRGAILVAGTCDHPAPLHQATELSVRGLVLGSMTAELLAVARRLPYPVLLTEGFGSAPLSATAYNLLSTNAGREVAVEAVGGDPFGYQQPEVIIPLTGSQMMDRPERVIPLATGVRVKVIRGPNRSAVGVVRELIDRAEPYPSGILARSANIQVEGQGLIVVPQANLEVVA
jgi:hypothetical protein